MGVQKGRHENTNKKKFFSKCAAAAFRAVSGKATALSYTELFSRKIKVLQAKVYKKTKEEHGFSSCYEQQTRTFVLPTYSLRSKYCDNTSKSKMFLLTTQQRALPAGYVPETKKFSKKKPKKLNQIMPLAAIKTRARITAAIGGSDFFADAEQKLDYA